MTINFLFASYDSLLFEIHFTRLKNLIMKTAWVFPGQGSQSLGMGADLVDLAFAKTRLKQAQDILGWDVAEICLNRESKLSQTTFIKLWGILYIRRSINVFFFNKSQCVIIYQLHKHYIINYLINQKITSLLIKI